MFSILVFYSPVPCLLLNNLLQKQYTRKFVSTITSQLTKFVNQLNSNASQPETYYYTIDWLANNSRKISFDNFHPKLYIHAHSYLEYALITGGC